MPMKSKRKHSQDNHLREQFIAQVESCQPFFTLLAQLPDVHFFMKDREGRFMAAGPGILRRLNMTEESEIIGKSDKDIHPPRTVEELRRDDLQVMTSGQPLINKIESLYSPDPGNNWFITTKVPIYNRDHEVIGLIGTTRPYQNTENPTSEIKRISRSLAHIQQHHREAITPDDLAALEKISVRQLNRLYQKVFGTPVGHFIMRTRIQSASNALLTTNLSVAAIAEHHGFSDQSSFTRQFRHHTGETPLKYRARRK
jgi:AraC-like DNA-binding protein